MGNLKSNLSYTVTKHKNKGRKKSNFIDVFKKISQETSKLYK